MRAERASPPPKALHLFMFLSVSDFLARLRTFLLTPHPKSPFRRPTLGSQRSDKSSPNRFALTRQLRGKAPHDFPEYTNIFSVLGVADQKLPRSVGRSHHHERATDPDIYDKESHEMALLQKASLGDQMSYWTNLVGACYLVVLFSGSVMPKPGARVFTVAMGS